MKIIIAALPFTGHLNPMLDVARHLRERGHEVAVLTGSTQRRRVTAQGLDFYPLPPSIDIDPDDLDGAFPERREVPAGPARIGFDIEHIFIRPMNEQARMLRVLAENFRADAIVAEHMFTGVIPLLCHAGADRPAIVTFGITPLLYPRDDHAPMGAALPYAEDPQTKAHYRDVVAPALAEMMASAQAAFETQFRALGLPAPVMPLLEQTTRLVDRHLQFGVPGLDYPRAHLPASIQFIGLPPMSPSDVEKPKWAAEVDQYADVVLVTQGTVENDDFDRLIRPTIKVLAGRPDTLVIVTGGGRETSSLGVLPANVRAARYLPFDWLLPKLSALVTNGGYGTVMQALAAGVPIVAAGTTEDKPEVTARVAWTGAGIDLRTDRPEQEPLRQALEAVLTRPSYRAAAQRLAAEFATHDAWAIIDRTLAEVIGLRSRAPAKTASVF